MRARAIERAARANAAAAAAAAEAAEAAAAAATQPTNQPHPAKQLARSNQHPLLYTP